MPYRSWALSCLLLALPFGNSQADTALRYRVNAEKLDQTVLVKQHKLLIRGVDDKRRKDLLFDRSRNELFLIDHRKRNFTSLNEETLHRLDRQTEPLQPLLQGLSGQIGRLTPEQRAKWEKMLGGVDLQRLAEEGRKSHLPTRVVKTGHTRLIAGYTCESIDALQGKIKLAEICLSPPATLGLPQDDYATIRALFDFAAKIAEKSRGFSSLAGISIPAVPVGELPGVPVEVRSFHAKRLETLSLNGIDMAEVAAATMEVPHHYQAKPFTFW